MDFCILKASSPPSKTSAAYLLHFILVNSALERGSIILRQLPQGGLPQTFINQNKYFETEFLTLLSNYLQKLDIGFEPLPLPKLANRYVGDCAANGKGEILILHN